jgi:P-type Cu+ transporter
MLDTAARRFTWTVLLIAVGTGVYWYYHDASQMWLVLTSVLMVACPCALALTAPFTYGSMQRMFGRRGFYLKNADVIERLAKVNAVVFDKTGTVTHGATAVKFTGALDDHELAWVKILASASSHPLSSLIAKSIEMELDSPVTDFFEKQGMGIEGHVDGHTVQLGSAEFVKMENHPPAASTRVFVSIDRQVRGYFNIGTQVRAGVGELLTQLNGRAISMLSGDSEADREKMKQVFPPSAQLHFNQGPHDKLNYISRLQAEGKKVLMLGDGLNDSGALKQSDVGVAITDDTGVFTPGCDGILEGRRLGELNRFLSLASWATLILKSGFGISFFYNVVALSFAVSGHLTPLIAAVLMPVSSISVVGFSTLSVNLVARKIFRS